MSDRALVAAGVEGALSGSPTEAGGTPRFGGPDESICRHCTASGDERKTWAAIGPSSCSR
jgi:hypothetical protein